MTTHTTAVVVDRKRKARAAIASGVAIALLGGGAGFSLLTEEHRVNQTIRAGGQLALAVNGERDGSVDLEIADGALPGDIFEREVHIENVGDVPASIDLAMRDGSVDGVASSDALDSVARVGVDNSEGGSLDLGALAGAQSISVLPERDDLFDPQVTDVTVLAPGQAVTILMRAEVNTDLVGVVGWENVTGGSTSAILTVIGNQVASTDDQGQGSVVNLTGFPADDWFMVQVGDGLLFDWRQVDRSGGNASITLPEEWDAHRTGQHSISVGRGTPQFAEAVWIDPVTDLSAEANRKPASIHVAGSEFSGPGFLEVWFHENGWNLDPNGDDMVHVTITRDSDGYVVLDEARPLWNEWWEDEMSRATEFISLRNVPAGDFTVDVQWPDRFGQPNSVGSATVTDNPSSVSFAAEFVGSDLIRVHYEVDGFEPYSEVQLSLADPNGTQLGIETWGWGLVPVDGAGTGSGSIDFNMHQGPHPSGVFTLQAVSSDWTLTAEATQFIDMSAIGGSDGDGSITADDVYMNEMWVDDSSTFPTFVFVVGGFPESESFDFSLEGPGTVESQWSSATGDDLHRFEFEMDGSLSGDYVFTVRGNQSGVERSWNLSFDWSGGLQFS